MWSSASDRPLSSPAPVFDIGDNGDMKEYKSSETERMKWRRCRARKKLGAEAVPLRPPGRPPRGTEDSPYTEDADLPLISVWYVHLLDQLPWQPDRGRAREIAALRACVNSWGELFAAEAEEWAEDDWYEPRCTICKGPIRPDTRFGVCHRRPECKREARRRYDRAARRR